MSEHIIKKSLSMSTHALRIRWAAIGAAIAVSLGGGVTLFAQAGAAPATSSTFVAVSPVRVLDTRDAVVLWAGPFVTGVPHDVKVTGSIPTGAGTQTVMPAGSTGVVLNVTVVNSTADGYVSVRPADAVGAPQTSNINFEARKTVANSITVNLPTSGADAGTFEVWFDSMGVAGATADILVDVTGYYTSTSIAEIETAIDNKSDAIAIIGSGGEDFGDIQLTGEYSGVVWDNGHWLSIDRWGVQTDALYFVSSDCSGAPWKLDWSGDVIVVFNNNVGAYFGTNTADSVTADVNNFHSVSTGFCETDLLPAAFKTGGEWWNSFSTRLESDVTYWGADVLGPTSAAVNAMWVQQSTGGLLSFVPRSSLNAAG
ncbi:MAG: hypothetical protein F2780_09420 [Actinobacteria bacterium]|nr:hypothetical protein [Actinomycetota bacterium]